MSDFVEAIKTIDWKNINNEPIKYFKQISMELPYYKYMELPNCHLGQRKLLLCEIMFYNILPKDSIIIYSGSAAGIHTPVMLELYPTFKFIFIDPNYHRMDYDYHYIYKNESVIDKDNKAYVKKRTKTEDQTKVFANGFSYDIYDNKSHGSLEDFNIKLFEKSKVWVIQDYMTPELARSLYKMLFNETLYHVSDIRSTMFEKDRPTDADILHNSALQILVHKELKPKLAYLKFVMPPYMRRRDEVIPKIEKHEYLLKCKELGYDFIDSYNNGTMPYFEGEIFIQPWAPTTSSELRVLVDQPDLVKAIKFYNILECRKKMIFYNIFRCFIPTKGFNMKYKKLGYDACNDCALEIKLLEHLCKSRGWDFKKLHDFMNEVTGYKITGNVKCPRHGHLIEYEGIHFKFDIEYIDYEVNVD